MSAPSKNYQTVSDISTEKMSQKSLVASSPRTIFPKAFKRMVPSKDLSFRGGSTSHVVSFLLKVAALETVRRFSKTRCPFVWQTVQALQVLGYPPCKWIQRWEPLKFIVKGIQKLSRPLLFLSVMTAFSDHSEHCSRATDSTEDSQPHSELSRRSSSSDVRDFDEPTKEIVLDNWLLQLSRELEKQGITLPERFNEDELCRFHSAANGDLSCLLSSLKRTIRWRETFHILSLQELEMWSHLVFWHGFDMMLRPCLVIRLGLACSSLFPHDRPRFAQAVVSQIEHGVLHLINEEDPRITVLMDCQGLSPFRFPMQMMRSFSTLVQEHYPTRLGALYVVRLPRVVRVIAQTFIQVLKPATRQKLHVEGDAYQKVLTEFLQTVPAFLCGNCSCSQCQQLLVTANLDVQTEAGNNRRTVRDNSYDESAGTNHVTTSELPLETNCDHVLRSAIVAFLMIWIYIAFLAGMNDP
ncbi:uncharacterized protein [Typha latifolia]|uniref:uncharacterized protein n=1 Tax=Typha latifolia TaxID=4733 RepID=UPI003C308B6B